MTAVEIGRKIKQLRIQKGLTLEELASRSELTKGFLSQLERELTSPSIATLNDIVEALGSSLAEFFKEEEQEQLVSGEEFGYVLEGAIILMVGEEKHIVHKGETFYLSGKSRHYLKNEKKTTAKVLWVSTPPLF